MSDNLGQRKKGKHVWVERVLRPGYSEVTHLDRPSWTDLFILFLSTWASQTVGIKLNVALVYIQQEGMAQTLTVIYINCHLAYKNCNFWFLTTYRSFFKTDRVSLLVTSPILLQLFLYSSSWSDLLHSEQSIQETFVIDVTAPLSIAFGVPV